MSSRQPSARRARALAIALTALIAANGVRAQSSSAGYVQHQSTANSGGAETSSASYVLNASAGQKAVIGTSSSPASQMFVLQSGFWSFAGSGVVPVVLMVDRSANMPENVDLTWSGNNAPYRVYQTTDCSDVFGVLHITETTNGLSDLAPPTASLVCFNVLPSSPGP